MIVHFHTDPVDLDAICSDLSLDGVVVVVTTRPNFRAIADCVTDRMPDGVLPLAAETGDHDWHHYLINTVIETFEASATGKRVAAAVEKWQAAGAPFPGRVSV